MTNDQRERLRIVIQSAILVRRGEVINDAVAEERARNLVTIIECSLDIFAEETTEPGIAP